MEARQRIKDAARDWLAGVAAFAAAGGIYTVQRPGHPPRQPVTVRQFLSWLELHDMKALPAEAERQQSDGEAARVLARFADMSRHELAVVMSGARLLWQEQADSA
jgi:hypothetical protein